MVNLRGNLNEVALDGHLNNDAGVVFDIRGRTYFGCEFSNLIGATHEINLTILPKLINNSPHIDRLRGFEKFNDGGVNLLVAVIIKVFRLKEFNDLRQGIFLQHERSQYSLLKIKRLRWQFAKAFRDISRKKFTWPAA